MEERSVAILTILIIIFFIILHKKSNNDLYVIQNANQISNIKTEEAQENKNITYPSSAIWKVGETLTLGDIKESENGLYKIGVINKNFNGNIFVSLEAYNPKYENLSL